MRLNKLKLINYILLFLLSSCSNNDNNVEDIVIVTNDYETTIDENPTKNQILGKISASINVGTLSYIVISQTPSNSVNIDKNTGELYIENENLFNYEQNNTVTGIIEAVYATEKKTLGFKININDVIEPLQYSKIENSNEIFQKRELHQALEFKNKLWVIGGEGYSEYYNDIWSSEDGISWEKISTNNNFSTTNGHQSIVFNNQLWIIGGRDNANVNNEIWVSDDGIEWTEIIPEGEYFEPVVQHRLVEFKEKLWLIGGWKNNNLRSSNEVWYSEDGSNWQLAGTTSPIFSARAAHEVIVFKDKIWLIGGYDGYQNNEIWSSNDGINWEKIEPNGTYFAPRSGHQLVLFQEKLWVIGGIDEARNTSNEIWSSNDGINWTKENIVSLNFPNIHNHQSLIFNDKIWVISGNRSNQDSGLLNTIWHTN